MSPRSSLASSRSGPSSSTRHSRRAAREKHSKVLAHTAAPTKAFSSGKPPARITFGLNYDIDKLRQLKELILSGSHPLFTAVPKPVPYPVITESLRTADNTAHAALSPSSRVHPSPDHGIDGERNVEFLDQSVDVFPAAPLVVDDSDTNGVPEPATIVTSDDAVRLITGPSDPVGNDAPDAPTIPVQPFAHMSPCLSAPPSTPPLKASLADSPTSPSPSPSSGRPSLLHVPPVTESEQPAKLVLTDYHDGPLRPPSFVPCSFDGSQSFLTDLHEEPISRLDLIESVALRTEADQSLVTVLANTELSSSPLRHSPTPHSVDILIKKEDSDTEAKLSHLADDHLMSDVTSPDGKPLDYTAADAKGIQLKPDPLSLRERIGPVAASVPNARRHTQANRGRRSRGRSQTSRAAQGPRRHGSSQQLSSERDYRTLVKPSEMGRSPNMSVRDGRGEDGDRFELERPFMRSPEADHAGPSLPLRWDPTGADDVTHPLAPWETQSSQTRHLDRFAAMHSLPGPAFVSSVDHERFNADARMEHASAFTDAHGRWNSEETSRRTSEDQSNFHLGPPRDQYMYQAPAADEGQYSPRSRFRSHSPSSLERGFYEYGRRHASPSSSLPQRAAQPLPFARRSVSPPMGVYHRSMSPGMHEARSRYRYSHSPPLTDQYYRVDDGDRRLDRSPPHIPLAARLSDPYDRRPVDDLSLAPYGHASSAHAVPYSSIAASRRNGRPFDGHHGSGDDDMNTYTSFSHDRYYVEDGTDYTVAEGASTAKGFEAPYARYDPPSDWASYESLNRAPESDRYYDHRNSSYPYPRDVDRRTPQYSPFYR